LRNDNEKVSDDATKSNKYLGNKGVIRYTTWFGVEGRLQMQPVRTNDEANNAPMAHMASTTAPSPASLGDSTESQQQRQQLIQPTRFVYQQPNIMFLALGFCHKDYLTAEKLFRWMAELDGIQNHTVLLMESNGMRSDQIKRAARKAFQVVVSKMIWKQDERGWPASSSTCS
jgi:hypothetical protein